MGKSKKKPYKPNSEDTNQEKLYLLHMDICGPMHVTSVNEKNLKHLSDESEQIMEVNLLIKLCVNIMRSSSSRTPEPNEINRNHTSSTTVDQDAPSPGKSQTTHETQSLVISNDVKEENHDLNVAHMNNDPFFGIPILENVSEASYSSDVIPTIVHTAAPNSKHVTK
ncbi:hypothetical protein Tco_1514279 [Tanacetum coccineum]